MSASSELQSENRNLFLDKLWDCLRTSFLFSQAPQGVWVYSSVLTVACTQLSVTTASQRISFYQRKNDGVRMDESAFYLYGLKTHKRVSHLYIWIIRTRILRGYRCKHRWRIWIWGDVQQLLVYYQTGKIAGHLYGGAPDLYLASVFFILTKCSCSVSLLH